MKSNKIPVTFRNRDDLKLFGILHTPETVTQKSAIVILSPGIKSRVAPYRMYLKMAERYCEMGFIVFRFDFYGLGDSEGEIEEALVADLYGSIQVGRYVEDTISAMNWIQSSYDIESFVLTGLCGGAITGLLAGAKDKRVQSLIAISIPVILDSSDIEYDNFLTDGELKSKGQKYLQKLYSFRSWRSWIRFITFQSDYKLIAKSVKQVVFGNKNTSENEKKTTEINHQDNFNRLFPIAFEKMLSADQKIFLLFAESDRLYFQFMESFYNKHNSLFNKYASNIEQHTVRKANHIFSFTEWQKEFIEVTSVWLKNNHHQSQIPSQH